LNLLIASCEADPGIAALGNFPLNQEKENTRHNNDANLLELLVKLPVSNREVFIQPGKDRSFIRWRNQGKSLGILGRSFENCEPLVARPDYLRGNLGKGSRVDWELRSAHEMDEDTYSWNWHLNLGPNPQFQSLSW